MLFNKVITLSALTTLAVATAIPRTGGGGGDSATVCCQQVQQASTVQAGPLWPILVKLGIPLGPLDALVGLNCGPITVIGNNNGACPTGTTAVDCQDNSHDPLLSIGCVPVVV